MWIHLKTEIQSNGQRFNNNTKSVCLSWNSTRLTKTTIYKFFLKLSQQWNRSKLATFHILASCWSQRKPCKRESVGKVNVSVQWLVRQWSGTCLAGVCSDQWTLVSVLTPDTSQWRLVLAGRADSRYFQNRVSVMRDLRVATGTTAHFSRQEELALEVRFMTYLLQGL